MQLDVLLKLALVADMDESDTTTLTDYNIDRLILDNMKSLSNDDKLKLVKMAAKTIDHPPVCMDEAIMIRNTAVAAGVSATVPWALLSIAVVFIVLYLIFGNDDVVVDAVMDIQNVLYIMFIK